MVFNTHILHLAIGAPSKQCWGVTYSSNSICVLNGSSVDISGSHGVNISVTGKPFNYFDNEMCVHVALCPPTHNISSSSAGADNS